LAAAKLTMAVTDGSLPAASREAPPHIEWPITTELGPTAP
jgi:hypothetical protein